MATVSITPDQDSVLGEIFIAAPPMRVFDALTDPNQLPQWWGQNGRYRLTTCHNDIRPGGRWESVGLGSDGKEFVASGEYVEVSPPHRLVYTWKGDWDGGAPSVVHWDLASSGDGTMVKLRHSGFAAHPEAGKRYSGGWPSVLGWMKAFVEKDENVDTRRG
jgi:uncharacterized protein YndB with AHSA1/START domain